MANTIETPKSIKAFQDEKFEWLASTNRRVTRSSRDITITKGFYKTKNGRNIRYTITFRNDLHEVFGECVNLAVFKNRVFFRPSSLRENGFKFYGVGKQNPFIQVTGNEDTKILDKYVGDYDLKFDPFYDLYYIETSEEEE